MPGLTGLESPDVHEAAGDQVAGLARTRFAAAAPDVDLALTSPVMRIARGI